MDMSPMARSISAPEPQNQANMVRAVIEPKLEDGDDWYVMSLRWWDLWKEYTCFDDPSKFEAFGDSDAIRRTTSGFTKGNCPPEIDNSDLMMGEGSSRLQKGLMERRDFMLVHKDAWRLLFSWYGGGPGIKRRVISVSTGSSTELRVELYPYWLSVVPVDAGGISLTDSKMDVIFSRSETIQNVLTQLCLNLELKDDSNDSVRLWHRSSFEVDQTDTDALEGWEQLYPLTSTLEDLQVVDGGALLLEQPNLITSTMDPTKVLKTTWPFFHRLRIAHKEAAYKKPGDPSTKLEVNDKIDACAEGKEKKFNSITRNWEFESVETWYAATVVTEEESRVLVQFHNRQKPKGDKVSTDTLIIKGESCSEKDPIVIGNQYESLDSKSTWHPVTITTLNTGGSSYVAFVEDEAINWDVVFVGNVRARSTLTEDAVTALTKVFKRYADNGRIEGGAIRGLMSCATNEYIQEDSNRITELMKKPYGDGTGIAEDGFLEYWRTRLAASTGTTNGGWWVQQELTRLFERVGAQVKTPTEEEQLLLKGQEWIERASARLSQYRSKSEPDWNGTRSFRDFRRWDNLDVHLEGQWKQAQVQEVNWEEMTLLVRTKDPTTTLSSFSSTFKAQSEWMPMESDRICEYQTKSLESAEEESDPAPLLARSTSRGGVCAKPGACGLQNLGNTCFMNSTLQCLSNTAALRYFFAGGPDKAPEFNSQICTSPLSMEGKLAKEFSRTLRQMWSNANTSVAPAQLKKLIAVKRPEFSGYQQHDAHELLSFLLDGLHEDVNRAPYPREHVEDEDLAGLAEAVVAKKMWDKHLKNNNSKIVELFQFQIRSELECPECANISVTFDPIMYLSLPVPKPPHSVELTVIPLDFPVSPMATINVVIERDATFKDLEVAIWNHLGVQPVRRTSTSILEGASPDQQTTFAFADVLGDRIWRFFEKRNRMSDIKSNDKVYAIEAALSKDVPEESHTFVSVVFRKRQRSTFSAVSDWQYQRCACPRVVAVTKGTSNAQVYAQLKGMAEAMLGCSKVPQPWQYGIVSKLDSYGTGTGTELTDDSEEFAVPLLASVDFRDEEQARVMKDGLPQVTAGDEAAPAASSGGTSLQTCLNKNAEREQLSEADTVFCGKCKEHRRQFKKLNLWSLPEILIVHFRRFGRDRIDGPLEKINCPIEFPAELDLSEYMCTKEVFPKFELFAVSNHEGNLGGGHYTAHAMVTSTSDTGSKGGEWFKFNDASVHRTEFKDLDRKAAYFLFYRRVSSPESSD